MLTKILLFMIFLSIDGHAKELCYGIDRKGNIEPYPIEKRADCLKEASLYRSRLGSNKNLLSVNWGDMSKVDAKVFIAKKDFSEGQNSRGKCPETIKSSARMVPNIIPGSGGQISGLRVVVIESASFWERSGLKSMDTITSINGRLLRDSVAINEAMGALSVGKNSFEVERNGSRMSLTIECPPLK